MIWFSRKPKETADSKLKRTFEEWYAHNTGLDLYYSVGEMIQLGILSKPVYETPPLNQTKDESKA